MTVSGICSRRFSQVRNEFERNFAERGEVGASVCIKVRGETEVDLWGGVAHPATDTTEAVPWGRDTILHVFSCTKGATALCAHILASRGQLDLNAPVSAYWPEYTSFGKDKTLIRQLLAHQSGQAAVRAALPAGAFYDWQYMTQTLAAEEPFWQPGTRHGYHAFTFGYLVGEVIRRVSGRSLGTFFRQEVAQPLGLDFWIGLPAEEEPRVAPTIPAPPPQPGQPLPSFYQAALADPTSVQALTLFNTGGYLTTPGESDSRAAHAAEMGAVGAITNARGLAGMYEPLANGGAINRIRLVRSDHLVLMAAVASTTSIDFNLLVPMRLSLGYVKSTDNRYLPPADSEGVLLYETALSHTGFGGSIGFAEPDARMSFGYAMTQQGPGLGVNQRGQSLIDAAYRALGYHPCPGGFARD